MPYYGQRANYGDNYGRAGNYPYQAGGIFSFLGGVAKTIGGVLPGPLGALAKGVGGILAPSRAIAPPPFVPQRPIYSGGLQLGPIQAGLQLGAGAGPAGFGPPPDPFGGVPVGTMLRDGFIPGCQLKGTRPNKSSYWKRIGGPGSMSAVLIPKGSVCVKTRRINIANPRALRRAVRRAQGFAKMARRVMTFVSAKAPKGRAKFKKR